jgi:hypothetical protein
MSPPRSPAKPDGFRARGHGAARYGLPRPQKPSACRTRAEGEEPMSHNNGKIIDLHTKLRDKEKRKESASMAVRRLARVLREMQEDGATFQEIARLLRGTANNLDGERPAWHSPAVRLPRYCACFVPSYA